MPLCRAKVFAAIVSGVFWVVCCKTLWKIPGLLEEHEDYYSTTAKPDALRRSSSQVLVSRDDSESVVSTLGAQRNGNNNNLLSLKVHAGQWQNQHNLVHVVHTRLLRSGQHTLPHLAQANLDLLQTLTLPSLRQQSNQDFLWIIWTDLRMSGASPSSAIRQQLVSLMTKQEAAGLNVVVLGGVERDEASDFRSLNGLALQEDLVDVLLMGGASQQVLVDYYSAAQSRLLVESIVDVGDAVSRHFCESVQSAAAARTQASDLVPSSLVVEEEKQNGEVARPRSGVEFYCPEYHLEWRHAKRAFESDNDDKEEDIRDNGIQRRGRLMQFQDRKFCPLTTGLSVSYTLDASARQVVHLLQDAAALNALKECPPEDHVHGTIRLPEKRECKGKGTISEKWKKEDLHHQESCPVPNALFCRGNHGTQTEFVGLDDLMLIKSRSGTNAAPKPQILECQVAGSNDAVMVSVTVSKSKSYGGKEPTQLQLSVDEQSPYLLAAVYVKGGPGGNLYTWQQTSQVPVLQSDNTTTLTTVVSAGGAQSAAVSSPSDQVVGHVDLCVLPKQILCPEPPKPKEKKEEEEDKRPFFPLDKAPVKPPPPPTQDPCRRKLVMVDDGRTEEQLRGKTIKNHEYIRSATLMAITPTAVGITKDAPVPLSFRQTKAVVESQPLLYATAPERAWTLLEHDFGASVEKVLALRRKLDDNMEEVLQEALDGSCLNPTTCRASTQEMLSTLLRKVQHYKLRQDGNQQS